MTNGIPDPGRASKAVELVAGADTLALQLFHHHGVALRTVFTLSDQEPWFVAADACRMLSLRDTTSAMKMVDVEDKQGLRRSDTPHLFEGMAPQVQMMTVVNESGLYSLIFQSDKAEAKDFRRWVTKEVLPAIRRTGSYSTRPAAPAQLPSKKELAQWVVEAEERAELAEAKARELAPAASAWNELAEAAGDYAVADAAKVLSRDENIRIGRDRLFTFMQGLRWVYRDKGWRAYQSQVDNGRLVEKVAKPYWHEARGEWVNGTPTVRITPKGLAELHRRLGGSGQLELMAVVS